MILASMKAYVYWVVYLHEKAAGLDIKSFGLMTASRSRIKAPCVTPDRERAYVVHKHTGKLRLKVRFLSQDRGTKNHIVVGPRLTSFQC